jgi:DNA-directed RNA polymerase specialized sigma24 family protein
MGPSDDASTGREGVFATTRWSVVLAAQGDSEQGRVALETLCRTYWFPVYAVVRRQGFDPDAARDFTQEFFARLLARDGLANARRDAGRFRSYLAQGVRNFLHDEWDRSQAQKRGGGQAVLSLDAEEAEGRYLDVPHGSTPDLEFDRQWAEQLLAQARMTLRAEYAASGRSTWIDLLEQTGDPNAPSLADQAARLGLSVNTLKSHLHRARQRHGAIIRELIADTVSTPVEVDAELRHLLSVLSG